MEIEISYGYEWAEHILTFVIGFLAGTCLTAAILAWIPRRR